MCCTEVGVDCEKVKIVLWELYGWATFDSSGLSGHQVSVVGDNTCSTSSPLHITKVGCSLWASSSKAVGESSRLRGTTNSKSQVHRSQRLSMHGTQQRAASGEDGIVYTWGTRCDQLVNATIQGALTYIRVRLRGSDECQPIGGVA